LRRVASAPSIPGIRTSISTTSGARAPTSSTASAPLLADLTLGTGWLSPPMLVWFLVCSAMLALRIRRSFARGMDGLQTAERS